MFGYVFAAAELGIRHEIWDLQNVPPVHRQLKASVIHYHVEVPVGDKKVRDELCRVLLMAVQWHKSKEGCDVDIPWPVPPGTDEVTAACPQCLDSAQVTTTLMWKLYNASKTLGPTSHKWTTTYYQAIA